MSDLPDPSALSRPWIAAYPPGVPPTYRYPPVALTRFLDDAARDFPDVAATRFAGATIEYGQLKSAVDALAASFGALGVRVGTHVAVALPNLPAFVIAAFAVWRVGAVLVPLHPELPDDELTALLLDAEAEVLITTSPRVPQVNRLRGNLPTLGHVIATGLEEWLRPLHRVVAPLRGRRQGWYRRLRPDDDVLTFAELADAGGNGVRQAPLSPDDTAAILYTGGTTGTRKGVVLSHGNLVANAFQARLWMPDVQAGRERMLAALPFFHSYGLTLAMLTGVLAAGTLVLLPRFDVEETLATIDRERPTLFPGVPTMYRDLAAHPTVGKHDLGSIRACVSGGAPLPPEVAQDFERLTGGARLREGYGLTEAGPLTHANPIYGRHEPGSIGLPVTDTVACVVDPREPGRALEPGEPGELAIFGPQVMVGYWKQAEETAAVLRDGWLLTGDVAVQDEAGTFRIVDRLKDLVIVGGVNVYPREVEEALLSHPGVRQAAVIGVPDERDGERVKAFVLLRPRSSASSAELLEHCRQRLLPEQVPVELLIRDTLPENLLGKVLRRDLRSETEDV